MTGPGARRVLLAAGGTGGHMFPAEALARELEARGFEVALATDRRGAAATGLPADRVHLVRAGGIATGPLHRRLSGAGQLAIGYLEASRLVARLRPLAAVGFGAYASVPAILAAARRGIPLVLHEQNAVLGRANRMLAPRATHVATSFGSLEGLRPADRHKLARTGNPVRAEIASLATRAYPSLTPGGPRQLLVLGGSLGARVFANVVPAALGRLPEALRQRLRLSQQCRAEDIDRVAADYERLGIPARLETFFADLPARLGAAHLVICRAGASTIAELAAAGRPAIIVPYPGAADDHQSANARALAEIGGAWPMPEAEFTPATLEARLRPLLDRPVSLGTAAMCARSSGQRDAARRLADLVVSTIRAGAASAYGASSAAASREAAA